MRERLIKSDEEKDYLIRKSGRERCECSTVLMIFTIIMTFVFLGKS